MKMFTSQQVADKFGITPQRVRQLAHSRDLGQKIGRDFIFSASDVKNMEKREPGNPNLKAKKKKSKKKSVKKP